MIKLPNFYACPRKHAAREENIGNMYRKYFQDPVPEDEQYWSMCGTHEKNGVFQQGSELGQLLECNLIKEYQFHGVDIEEEIINRNRESKPEVNWINDDFLHAMKTECIQDNFNPAIINADFISLKEKGSAITSQIMSFITEIKLDHVLLVANIMLTNPHALGGKKPEEVKIDPDTIVSEFERWNSFQYAWSSGNWSIHPEFYIYNGTGRQSRTIMGTFIFINKGGELFGKYV